MTNKPKAFIKTFGCQMNVNDSEYITGRLIKLGYSITEDIFKSNLILLNTCCVRAKVEQKIYSLIGKIKKIKKDNPDMILGICGCMAQKEKENIFERAPHVDFIFSPSQINNIKEIINTGKGSTGDINGKKSIAFFWNRPGVYIYEDTDHQGKRPPKHCFGPINDLDKEQWDNKAQSIRFNNIYIINENHENSLSNILVVAIIIDDIIKVSKHNNINN